MCFDKHRFPDSLQNLAILKYRSASKRCTTFMSISTSEICRVFFEGYYLSCNNAQESSLLLLKSPTSKLQEAGSLQEGTKSNKIQQDPVSIL